VTEHKDARLHSFIKTSQYDEIKTRFNSFLRDETALCVHVDTKTLQGGRQAARPRASLQCVSVTPCLREIDLS